MHIRQMNYITSHLWQNRFDEMIFRVRKDLTELLKPPFVVVYLFVVRVYVCTLVCPC